MLSGGEKARLALAKLMLQKSNFLILDEPTNHLDLDSKEVLESALMDYPGTILFVSHDRYFINKLATKVLSFENGTFREFLGDYTYFMEKIKEEDERKKIQAESQTQSTYFKSNIVKEAKVQFALNKEEQKQKRKKQRRLEEIEKKIEDTEQIISACQAKLCDPEIFSDFEKSNIIQTTLNENEEKLQQLYEEWEALQR